MLLITWLTPQDCSFEPSSFNVQPEDWTQFQLEYAAKVTRLDIDRALTTPSRALLNGLLTKHGGVLCPRLRYAEINPTDCGFEEEEGYEDIWTPMVALVVPPTLDKVQIGQAHLTDRGLDRMMVAFAQKAPHITDVTVYTPVASPDYVVFKEMKRLMIDGWVDHEAWKSLANCEHLENLELWEGPGEDASGGDAPDMEATEDYAITLPKLKTLLIDDPDETRDPEFIDSIFRNTTMPLLLTVEVGCSGEIDAKMIRKLLRQRSPLLHTVLLNRSPGDESDGSEGGAAHAGGDGEASDSD